MFRTNEIYAVLEERRKELGLSQTEVSRRALNASDASPFQNIRRGSSPTVEKLEALAAALDLEFYFGRKQPEAHSATVGGKSSTYPMVLAEASGGNDLHKIDPLRAGYLPIPYHEAEGQRGTSPLALHRSWINGHALDIEALCCVTVDLPEDRVAGAGPRLLIIDRAAERSGSAAWVWREAESAHEAIAPPRQGRVRAGRATFEGKRVIFVDFDPSRTPFSSASSDVRAQPLGRIVPVDRPPAPP